MGTQRSLSNMSSFAQKGGPETSNPAHWFAVFGAGVSVAMLGYMYACRHYQSDKTVAQVFREAKMKMARGLIHDAVGMFEEADLDHNGELSRTELESFLLSHPNMVHTLARHGIESVTAFDQMDVNADGSISKQEFLSAVLPVVVFETTVHDIFAQYDKDQLSKSSSRTPSTRWAP